MLPEFYRTCLKSQLSESQLHTLEILVWLLQCHKQVRIERLAACMPLPILFESRRRHLQRFLILPQLSVALLWLPLIKCILRTQIKPETQVIVTLDRTSWAENNLLMVSVVWVRRTWPVYWQFMDKKGNSNLAQQKAVLRPAFLLLKRYQIVVVGDREFHSVKLANWRLRAESELCHATETGNLHSSRRPRLPKIEPDRFSFGNEAVFERSYFQ